MKAKLPALLAAALLLAAAPAFADDLLDAVLWDGPSASPAESAPRPAPSPAIVPVSEVRPAAPVTVPGGMVPQPVPRTGTPAPGPSAAEPVYFGSSTAASTSAPAVPSTTTSAPAVPSAAEQQIRHEIEEMRARADRLEAALGPATPPKPARPPYDLADWPSRPRLSLRGGGQRGADDQSGAGDLELVIPIGKMPFDAAVRGFGLGRKYVGYTEYGSAGYVWHSNEKNNFGVDVWGIWLPWRRNCFSPHAGVGLRFEKIAGDWENSWWRHYEHRSYDDEGFSLAGRVGATLTYKRLSLKGEFIIASESNELVGEIAIRLSERIMLTGFAERFDNEFQEKGADAGLAFGGGLTILFGHTPQP